MFSGLNFSGMQAEAYRGLPEVPGASDSFWNQTDVQAWINEGCLKVAEITECYEKGKTWEVTQYKREYTPPNDMLRPKSFRFRCEELDNKNYKEFDWTNETPADPEHYDLWKSKIYLDSIPASGAITTNLASGGITAGATTFAVADASLFARRGALTIVSEILNYEHRNGSTFYVVTRAQEATTASSYLTSAVVTERALIMDYFAMPPKLMSGDNVSVLPVEWHYEPPKYARIQAFKRDSKANEETKEEQMFVAEIVRMKKKRENKTRDKLPKIRDKAKRTPQ